MFSFLKKESSTKNKVNGISALSANELLAPYQHLITQIEQNTGVPQEHWKLNYLSFIANFSSKVQLLPASESHHHSSYGGLLEHSLETGLNALKLRRAKMLPIGANAEVIEKEKELWSYAIFTAAILHDVGKPLSDQIITIVNESSPRKFNPVTETLSEGSVYQLAFRRGRKYRSHENLPLLLASTLIPKIGLNWITSNPDILDEWTLCLTGRKAEAESIGDIITKADQISTARNLTGNTNISTPAAKTTPLHKRLVIALKYLLEHDELPLNRKGAAGWVFEDKLWLVSKRVIDAIRIHMREEGQTGIPSDNARIMDELTQHNIIQPTDHDLAIWKMDVSVGSWKNQFTLLCFPLIHLWADQSAWPVPSEEITVIQIIKPTTEPNEQSAEKQAKPNSSAKHMPVESYDLDDGTDLELPLPPGIELLEPVQELKAEPIPSIDETPSPELETVQSIPGNQDNEDVSSQGIISGSDFVDWLSNGIADGSISINQQQAMTHTIGDNKDLILVSPKIFRVYATKRNTDYKEVQRNFQLLGLHTQNAEKNIWPFKTLTKRNNKSSGQLNGMLIKNAEVKLNIRLPPKNSHIDYIK